MLSKEIDKACTNSEASHDFIIFHLVFLYYTKISEEPVRVEIRNRNCSKILCCTSNRELF